MNLKYIFVKYFLIIVASLMPVSVFAITERISVDSDDNQILGDTWPLGMSDDGRYVLFQSYADYIVPTDVNGQLDVFVRDTLSGTTVVVSADMSGNIGSSYSQGTSITPDGRYVLFNSYADNLVLNDTNGQQDVFVKDIIDGDVTLVTVDDAGIQANDYSFGYSITPDGRYVLFQSYAANLVLNDTNGYSEIFVRDIVNNTTTRVSVDNAGIEGNNISESAFFTPDGRYVLFTSFADNLVVNDTNGKYDVFLRDLQTLTTTLISVGLGGDIGENESMGLSISTDGRYVLFQSDASNLVINDINTARDIFVRDVVGGTTQMVNVDTDGNVTFGSTLPYAMTPDGRYVLFQSDAPLSIFDGYNGAQEVFVRDIFSGVTLLVSSNSSGEVSIDFSQPYAITPDGRYVLFQSYGSNLVPNDYNYTHDVFIKDMVNGMTSPVSINNIGLFGDGYSYPYSITPDGRYALFQSDSSNLVPNDTNYIQDIFINERQLILGVAPTIVSPVDGSYSNQTGDIHIQGLGESGADIRVTFLGNPFYTTVSSSNDWSLDVPGQLDASYTIYAQQKPYGAGVWSATGMNTFTIDTDKPLPPVIVNPLENNLFDGGVVYVYGQGEVGGEIVVKVGNTTLTGTKDGGGNWEAGPFYFSPGYRYAIVAQQTDIAGNKSDRSPITTFFGVSQGVVSVDTGSYSGDLMITQIPISSGSSSVVYPSGDIHYTVNYANVGNSYSTGVVIYEKIPANTCFTLGSITGLQYNMLVEYSNNSGMTYGYMPVGSVGQNDCAITDFRIVFLDYLMPKNNLLYADFSLGQRDNIVGTTSLYINGELYTQSLIGPSGPNMFGYGASADFDSDNKPDVLAMGFNGQTTIFKNTTVGNNITFNSTVIGPGGGSSFVGAKTGDFNGDSKIDVIGFGYNTFNTIFTNTSSGAVISFLTGAIGTHERTSYHHGGAVGDFNGDNKPDIIAAGHWGQTKIYENTTTGFVPTFTQTILGIGGNGYFVGADVADFNNDGKLDAVLGGHVGQTTIFVNISTGTNIVFNQLQVPAGGDYGGAPAVGDFNGDGKVDIIRSSINNNIVTNTTTGSTPSFTVSSASIQNGYLYTIDYNNDGKLDIISVPTRNGILKVYINTTVSNTIQFTEQDLSNTSPISPHGSVMADFNGDSQQDFFGFAWDGATYDNIVFNSQIISQTGSFLLQLSGNNTISTRNTLFINQSIISGDNDLHYTIFPVVSGLCDTGNILLGPTQPNLLGEIDISNITGVNQSICVKADFSIYTGSISPLLHGIIATWNNEDVDSFAFNVKVKPSGFLSSNVVNTIYISGYDIENDILNNVSTHSFTGLAITLPPPSGGFGGNQGGNLGNGTNTTSSNGGGTIIVKSGLTPQEVADKLEKIMKIDTNKPEKPVVVIPSVETVKVVEVKPTTPNLAIKDAIIQTSYVSVGTTVEVKTVSNPVLGSDKKCYTPKEVVDITLGKNTTNKDQLVYQALLKSYDLTIFSDTDTYMPENGLKRYEAAKMFTNFAKHVLCRESTSVYANTYTDIQGIDETLRPYIIQAYEYGILKGSKNEFRPLERISRKEFVAALMRMFTNENMDIQGAGNDWDTNYQEAFKAYGLDSIVGIGEDINRYDMSKIMYKLYYNTTYEWIEKGYVLPYNY